MFQRPLYSGDEESSEADQNSYFFLKMIHSVVWCQRRITKKVRERDLLGDRGVMRRFTSVVLLGQFVGFESDFKSVLGLFGRSS